MGQQVSIETFSAPSGSDGHKYWASFDPYPFKAGSKKLSYMGYLNGTGPLKGQKCVVKTIRNGSLTRQDLQLETKKAKIAKEIATAYNKFVEDGFHEIIFNHPIITEIDQLSDCFCLADILGKPKKKIKELDYVSIELYIKGRFEDFEYGWVPKEDLVVPEAFSHFSWCKSEGEFLISNLQGARTKSAYHFTGPVIHSKEQTYGTSDMGLTGIKGFFRLHECNRICRNWPRLGDGRNLWLWAEAVERKLQVIPSAPPSPLPPPYFESQQRTMSNVRNGVPLNWMEQYTRPQIDSNFVPDEVFAPQFMWYVQQFSYAFIRPPPPYCECAVRRQGCVHDQKAISGSENPVDDDKASLLPPAYSDESADMNQSFSTYL